MKIRDIMACLAILVIACAAITWWEHRLIAPGDLPRIAERSAEIRSATVNDLLVMKNGEVLAIKETGHCTRTANASDVKREINLDTSQVLEVDHVAHKGSPDFNVTAGRFFGSK